jgi:3-oxoacyl-[acyl-carrier protein] reductase
MGAEFLARTPLGRLGVPGDLGKAAVFLCSSDADWITGETLLVDGGAHGSVGSTVIGM